MTKRVWIELKCPKCDKKWEIMSADAEGLRAIDTEQRECPTCRIRGDRTGAIIK
jgi:endogenous inhibitor of DNA gyrase (YacG/DUF329 family)